MPPRLLALLALLPWACAAASASFEKTVEPFLKANCYLCHNAKLKVSGLNLEAYADGKTALKDREVWEKVVQKLRGGQMPPKGLPTPPPDQVAAVTSWFDLEFARLDRSMKPDPGRVTARRLNRVEYNNTIRDLVGVDFKPAADFPADDSGYGFDNIGDVLSLSPVLMEKYLAAAEKIARQAIVADPPPKPTRERIEHAQVPPEDSPARDLTARHQFPVEGEYLVHGMISGRHEALLVTLWLDGKELKTFPVTTEDEAARMGEMRLHVTAGEHELKATLLHDDSRPDAEPDPDEVKAKDKKKKAGKDPYIDRFEINGPYNPHARPLTESHRRIFICGVDPGQQSPECARRIVAALGAPGLPASGNGSGGRRPGSIRRHGPAKRRFLRARRAPGARSHPGLAALPVPHRARSGREQSGGRAPRRRLRVGLAPLVFPVEQHAGRRAVPPGGRAASCASPTCWTPRCGAC